MEKYKRMLFYKIKEKMTQWFEDSRDRIPNEEVHAFLHSVKGTAGTIGLGGLLHVSSLLLKMSEERANLYWDRQELKDFLYDMVSLTYQFEHFQEEVPGKERYGPGENAPLIQIIDKDVSMLVLLKEEMEEKGWMVIASTKLEKAVESYYDHLPDCLIADIHLPVKQGFQLLEEFQLNSNKRFIPTIMISSENCSELRKKAYTLGADDFIEKPFDFEEFFIRVERQLQRKKLFDQSVLKDELTKVYNRRFFDETLERQIKERKRTGNPFALAMLDIDHFKHVNDTYGHAAGDRVLAEFSGFLKKSVRSTDMVFRYGGEEFAILFPRTSGSVAASILTRLLEEYSSKQFQENGETFKITFSAGVYMADGVSDDSQGILNSADQALYTAKKNGRARVECVHVVHPEQKKKLYVSVIDDDAIIRAILTKILENMEFSELELNVDSFEDGQAFLNSGKLQEAGKHFLILDGIMPVMDGIEVLQKVKRMEVSKHVHVLMLTGRKSESDISRALQLGADDYVTKPFSIKELEARIQRLIKRMF
ncbi:diguanylate cyclase [Mesobacillus zeae]|uniref:Response regulator n=1 Tax=Mesobacillus zeae TaxID=1917180 RepID=A0A398B3W6_9BACI|nr:diguanylate cyclase [Mesobacillus zeae]RID84719.1 response regulator [Mesobacillus zeae]